MGDRTLDDEPFSYDSSRDCLVRIAWQGKVVTHLKGKAAARFLDKAVYAIPHEQQLLMAKATGNFKRSNESAGKQYRQLRLGVMITNRAPPGKVHMRSSSTNSKQKNNHTA